MIERLLVDLHYAGTYTTRSDFARAYQEQIAEAACRGLITTELPDGSFGNVWRLTAKGLEELFNFGTRLRPKNATVPQGHGEALTSQGAGR